MRDRVADFGNFFRTVIWAVVRQTWQSTKPFISENIRRTTIYFTLAFCCGLFIHYFFSESEEKLREEIISYIIDGFVAALMAFVLIVVFNLFAAPFRIHYKNLRTHCPSYWLHRVEEQDEYDLTAALVIRLLQIQLQGIQGNYTLQIEFSVFNGSIYCIKFGDIIGAPPMIFDYTSQPQERVYLPPMTMKGKVKKAHHSEELRLNIVIPLTDELRDRIKNLRSRLTESYDPCRFDLRRSGVEIIPDETKSTFSLPLISISMSEALAHGLR